MKNKIPHVDPIQDRYINPSQSIERLFEEYKSHGNLYIAFDFDNTVFDFHKTGDTYPLMIKLLRFLKHNGFKLILFTGNEGAELDRAFAYCKQNGFEPDYVNESPITKMGVRKPMYSILLDDRAGLGEAFNILCETLFQLGFNFNEK